VKEREWVSGEVGGEFEWYCFCNDVGPADRKASRIRTFNIDTCIALHCTLLGVGTISTTNRHLTRHRFIFIYLFIEDTSLELLNDVFRASGRECARKINRS